MTQAPRAGTRTTLPDGREVDVLATIPLDFAHGYRVVVRDVDLSDPLDSETLVWTSDDEPPRALRHPVVWCDPDRPALPLACELRAGDTLPPARGRPGRPNLHREDADTLTPMTVTSVVWDGYDVRITTRDADGIVRRYHYDPEETIDFSRPRRRRTPRARAQAPEQFAGPYVSQTGAQFVFQARPAHGGRVPRNAPRFDETLPPLLHPDTGELIPYVVLAPPRSQPVSAVLRHPSVFTETARKMPEVRAILGEPAGDAVTDDTAALQTLLDGGREVAL